MAYWAILEWWERYLATWLGEIVHFRYQQDHRPIRWCLYRVTTQRGGNDYRGYFESPRSSRHPESSVTTASCRCHIAHIVVTKLLESCFFKNTWSTVADHEWTNQPLLKLHHHGMDWTASSCRHLGPSTEFTEVRHMWTINSCRMSCFT